MISVVSGGTAARIAVRILSNVLRAGSGTRARYSSTLFGAPLRLAAGLRFPDFRFFTSAILQEARGPRGMDILQAALGQALISRVIGIWQFPVSENPVFRELGKPGSTTTVFETTYQLTFPSAMHSIPPNRSQGPIQRGEA